MFVVFVISYRKHVCNVKDPYKSNINCFNDTKNFTSKYF